MLVCWLQRAELLVLTDSVTLLAGRDNGGQQDQAVT